MRQKIILILSATSLCLYYLVFGDSGTKSENSVQTEYTANLDGRTYSSIAPQHVIGAYERGLFKPAEERKAKRTNFDYAEPVTASIKKFSKSKVKELSRILSYAHNYLNKEQGKSQFQSSPTDSVTNYQIANAIVKLKYPSGELNQDYLRQRIVALNLIALSKYLSIGDCVSNIEILDRQWNVRWDRAKQVNLAFDISLMAKGCVEKFPSAFVDRIDGMNFHTQTKKQINLELKRHFGG